MPQKHLHLRSKEISQKLKRNTLSSGLCALAGFSLLIPAFSVEGSKFDYQEFCFKPPTIPETVTYCTGKRLKKGIAWRVALEATNNQEFQSKVTFLKFLPAQNPNAGVYGVCGAGFLMVSFLLFKQGTDDLGDNLDLLIWNKKSLVLERAFKNEQHISIESLKNQQEQEFVKDLMMREHAEAMYTLMGDGVTSIWDEQTNWILHDECTKSAKEFMGRVISDPRKSNEGVLVITHSFTNAGTGGSVGFAASREEGVLQLRLNADNEMRPLFKGKLLGFKDEEGELIDELKVTVPKDWFNPSAIKKLFSKF